MKNAQKRCSGSIPYGYNRVPSDKQALVVDPVAAEVVKRIFLLANEGKSTRAIAEKLTEEKILIPSAYAKEYHPEQYNGQKYSNPNLWGMSTVRGILERQEYLGHTVLRKTVGTNFKLHNRKSTAQDEQYVFQNTHEKAYREKRKAERLAANGGELVKKQVCPQCGKIFIPASSHQAFCSEGCCHQARQDQKQAEREAERGQHYYRQRICAICGNPYWPESSRSKFFPMLAGKRTTIK